MSKDRKRERQARLSNELIVLLLALAPVVMMIPVFLLIDVAERIGPWWVLLLAAYLLLVNWPAAYVLQQKELREMRFLVGDERFFDLYPKELDKQMKRARREPRYDRLLTVESYRRRLEAVDWSDYETEIGQHRQFCTVLYRIAAAIMFALAAYCLYGVFLQLREKAELSLILMVRLLSISMMLFTGMVSLRKMKTRLPGIVTAVLLFLKVWSDIANLVQKPAIYTAEPIIESAVILAVFLIAAFIVTGIGDTLDDGVRTRREQKEIDLDLYELGVIDEAELAFRFTK